jgi:hypothetical protein
MAARVGNVESAKAHKPVSINETKGTMHMFQTSHLNGADAGGSQPDDNSEASLPGIPDYDYSLANLALLVQDSNRMIAGGPRIILTCGPYDNEYDEEQPDQQV